MSQLLRKRRKGNFKLSKRRLKTKLPAAKNAGAPLLFFDCKPLCHAAMHVTGSLSHRGKPTGVIYSFIKQVFNIAARFRSNNLFFLWDAGKSYRHDIYPLYKNKREKRWEEMDADEWQTFEAFTMQILKLHHEVLPRLGFRNNYCFLNYEADDLIAMLVNKFHGNGQRLIVVSNDNDFYQLLDRADMYMPMREKVFKKRHFKKQYGIHPKQWVLAKSIGGCSGDDVPGIEGISDPKNSTSLALKYIRGELTKGKVYDKIVSDNGKKIIEQTRKLVELPCKPDLMPELIIKKNWVTKRKVIKLFDKYRFISLLEPEYFDKIQKTFWS